MGKFTTSSGKEMITPNILPVVHPREQVIPARVMHDRFGVDAIFTNAFIIHQDEGLSRRVLDGGIHAHLDFPSIIATDSGAFQHYMYGTGDLEPGTIEPFQERIGSDLGVILDQPVQVDDTREVAIRKVHTTLERAKLNVDRRHAPGTAWYGPVHGGRFPDLLERSATVLNGLDFAVHALGGVVKLLNDYQFTLVAKIVLHAKQWLDPSRPVHLFGAGHPMVFSLFTALGCDLFDSAAYSLFAREGRYLTTSGTLLLDDLVEFPCSCPACSASTPRETRGLPPSERHRFLCEHNLHVTMGEFKVIREHVRAQTLWELVETRCRAHPCLLEALRMVNQWHRSRHAGEVSAGEPILGRHAIFYTGPETLDRPIIHRFKEDLASRYKIGKEVSRMLLLPELDVNAISSPQHARWQEAIGETLGSDPAARARLLVVLLNPVLGVIPEDLLPMHPCSHNLYPSQVDATQERRLVASIVGFLARNDVHGKPVAILIPRSFTGEDGMQHPFDGHYLETNLPMIPLGETQRSHLRGELVEDLPREGTRARGTFGMDTATRHDLEPVVLLRDEKELTTWLA
ncbi:tRNA guanosine(15) transglycosylase TgtA [Candidatus Bathyarchaeota archaeon]|nr:tRNA guanosine(15) transglycosylase TgtA [Candidatus Bathyarchaeota archaeon]